MSIDSLDNLVDAKYIAAIYNRTPQWVNGLARKGRITWYGVKNGARTCRLFDPEEVHRELTHEKGGSEEHHPGEAGHQANRSGESIRPVMKLNRIEQRKVDEFIRRYKAKTEPIDNSRLPAGSPMYFYCKACGCYLTALPEGYLSVPTRYCEACEDLKKEALLDEALRRSQA